MVLVVNDKSYPVNVASSSITYNDSSSVIYLYINVSSNNSEDFVELASALKTHIIIIPADQSASGTEEIVVNTDDATAVPMYLLKTNNERIYFNNYVPESINQNFSDFDQSIVLTFTREFISSNDVIPEEEND